MSKLEAVWSSSLSTVDADAYDAFVATARGSHHTQTRAWAALERAARPTLCRYFLARRGGRVVGAALVLRPLVLSLIASPFARTVRGPVCDKLEDLPDVLDVLVGHTRRAGILRLGVMPYWSGNDKSRAEHALMTSGYHDVQKPDAYHVRSLRLDVLGLPEPDPLLGPKLAKVRREIRRAERAGARVRSGERRDLAPFRTMHEERLRREGHRLPATEWYEALADHFARPEQGAMFVCEYRNDVIAAVFVARHGGLATYVLGESTSSQHSFPKMIQPLAAAISWAKTEGLATFDLGGIPMQSDEDAKRASIAEYKRSFSRDEIFLVNEHARWL